MKYNSAPFYICFLFGLFATNEQAPARFKIQRLVQSDTADPASTLLTLADAEKIMGEPAKLTGNSFIDKGDTLEYKCDYTALSQDPVTQKTGKLYFMYEIYSGAAAAASAYADIYKANSAHEGVEIVKGLGTEAYYHSDQTGFYFYLVRKNEKMCRLKLNKITSHSSLPEFKEAIKRVVDKL